jgi:CRP-like cAMP-binding protein
MPEHRTTLTLGAAPLFAGLLPYDISRVAAFSRYRTFEAGDFLAAEGDTPTFFYVIAEGQVKVYKTSADGRELIIKIMRKGDLVGEAAALAGRPYPATARALDHAAAVEIPRREFVELIKKEPGLALNMIANLSERLHHLGARLETFTLKEVPGRLASYLLEHADDHGRVDLTITKTDLAAELGTVPETLSRALRKMIDAGFIRAEEKHIVVEDAAALMKLSAGVDKR